MKYDEDGYAGVDEMYKARASHTEQPLGVTEADIARAHPHGLEALDADGNVYAVESEDVEEDDAEDGDENSEDENPAPPADENSDTSKDQVVLVPPSI